jgi:hypothetical protein
MEFVVPAYRVPAAHAAVRNISNAAQKKTFAAVD